MAPVGAFFLAKGGTHYDGKKHRKIGTILFGQSRGI